MTTLKATVLFLLLLMLLTACTHTAQTIPEVSRSETITPSPSDMRHSETPAKKVRPPTRTATPWISRTPANTQTSIAVTPTNTPGPTKTFEPVFFSLDALTGNENEAIFFNSWDAGYFAYLDINDAQDLYFVDRALSAFRFANHDQMVSYFDWDSAWIVSLTNQRKMRLFEHEYPLDRETQVLWTPDDQHIIFDMDDGDSPAIIYHRKSGYFEEWPYRCDRLAISPQSRRAALWCPAEHDKNNWAVIEWGGEIWYDNKAPEKTIVKSYNFREASLHPGWKPNFNRVPIFRNAAWSSGGELIAFFDPEDQNGDLIIITAHGEEIERFKARAYWLSELTDAVAGLPGFPLQWSQNNSKLLIYGVGEENNPCPSSLRDEVIYENPGCWQVLDIKKGKTIWNINTFLDSLPDFEYLDPVKNELFFIGNASISQQGKYLSFYCCGPPDKKLYTLDIELDKIIDWTLVPDAQEIRWGLLSQE
jgi:hypothetical protein